MVSTVATQSRMASFTASFKRSAAGERRPHLGAQQAHAEHVERLALHVDLAHVDDAVEPEQRSRGGGGDAVLARPRLGDQPLLAHPPRQQRLAEHVVDLVAAGVVEVLPLEQHAAAELGAEAPALGQDRRATGVVAEQVVELGPERRVGPGGRERGLELLARRHERLGDEPAAEPAEATVGAGIAHHRFVVGHGHRPQRFARLLPQAETFFLPVVREVVVVALVAGTLRGARVADEVAHLDRVLAAR